MKPRGAPPPSGAAPAVSREIVNIVKKKLAAPSSAPPASMKSITNRGTAYKGIDEDDDDEDEDEDDNEEDEEEEDEEEVAKVFVKEKVEEDPRDSGAKEHIRRVSTESENIRTVDHRNSWENDDRSATSNRQGQFQQPRRAPYRHQERNDQDDDDEGSFEYESDDQSGYRGSKNFERFESDQRKRPTMANTNYNGMSEGKLDRDREREREIQRGAQAGSKGQPNQAVRKPATYNFQPLLKATYRELRSFVLSPCDPGITTRCYIERTRGAGNMFAPTYSLCADLEDGTGRELLVCRKVSVRIICLFQSLHPLFSLFSLL